MPISVLIPAYNAAATIARALDSVAAQAMAGLDLVVVDDGSADATATIAEAHPVGARVLRHPANAGSPAALTTALGAARFDTIAFLDADDEWRPGKLVAQLAAFTPETSLVATGFTFVSAAGAALWDWGAEPAARAGPEFWKALLEHSQIAKPTVLTRASAIARAGGFDPAMRVAEDQDMWIRLALMGPVAYLPQSLVLVHDGPASLMKRQASPDRDHVLPMVERHLAALAGRLTPAETRRVRARRYGAAAANLAGAGRWREALPFARMAIAHGDAALPHFRRIARALLG